MGGSVGGFIEDVTGIDMGDHGAGDKALAAQKDAARGANALQSQVYQDQKENLSPYMDAGKGALSQMQDPGFNKSFSMNDFQQDPGYAFRMAEGTKALERSAAARGGLMSGGTMKALAGYGQNLASQEYQNAFNRFHTDQNSRFGRLSTLAGMGQSSAAGVGAAGQNFANQVGGNQMGVANAQAGLAMGQANQLGGLMGGALTGAAAGYFGGKEGVKAVFSDERLKTNVTPISKEDIQELRECLKPYAFNYVSDEYGVGDWVGVMAQDLEKSKLGRTAIVENEDGFKMIDTRKVASLFLAAMAEG